MTFPYMFTLLYIHTKHRIFKFLMMMVMIGGIALLPHR